MIWIIGPGGSGKSLLAETICNNYGLNQYVMYTTRDKRPNEIDGVHYHFISDEEMDKKLSSLGDNACTMESLIVGQGVKRYLVDLTEIEGECVVVTSSDEWKHGKMVMSRNTDGYYNSNKDPFFTVMLMPGLDVQRRSLSIRYKDNAEEVERRVWHDNVMYNNINFNSGITVVNDLYLENDDDVAHMFDNIAGVVYTAYNIHKTLDFAMTSKIKTGKDDESKWYLLQ